LTTCLSLEINEYQMSAKKQLETTERFSPHDLPLSGEPFDDLSECARYYHREEIDTADFASWYTISRR